jgi:hypothetical protein
MDAKAGYVYILINPSLSGLVKIGKTQNSPDERAKELSSATGVPSPFFVAYSAYFKNCAGAEIFVHTRLGNNREAQNKEFFRVSLQQAIEALREAESTLGTTSPELSTSTGEKTETYFTWARYKAADTDYQTKILLDLVENLPLMTWKEQAKQFKGAPEDVILYCLPMLYPKAQVKVYNDYLPVGSYAKAQLSEEAKIALKLRRRNQCMA